MEVLFCFDRKYEQHFGVALTSLLLNHSNVPINLYIITDKASDKLVNNLEKLTQDYILSFYIHEVEEKKLSNLKISAHITEAAYYRLLVADIVPKEVKKILYLDSDLVVMGSLKDLYNLNLEDSYIAAYGNPSKSQSQRLKLENDFYFNSGVMLINLEKWRREQVGEKAIEFVKSNPELIKNWDQDALNKIIDGRCLNLEQKWNFLVDLRLLESEKKKKKKPRVDEHRIEINEPRIIHFIGSLKPWFFWCFNSQKNLYWLYLNKSLWKTSFIETIQNQLGYLKILANRRIKKLLKN